MTGVGYSNRGINLIGSMVTGSAGEEPLRLTGDWQDVGPEVQLQRYQNVGLYYNLDILDSKNVRFRLMAKCEYNAAGMHDLPIGGVGPIDEKINPLYKEIDRDVTQKGFLSWTLDKLIVSGQFQAMAEEPGASAAFVIAAAYTLAA